MKFISTQKFLKISPRKLRMVVSEIKQTQPVKAIEILSLTNKRGAKFLVKVIKAAVANAKMKGAVENDLIFKEIQVTEGPRLKRGNPVSRGRFHPIKKRMSHLRVVLETSEANPKNEVAKERKLEKGNPKKLKEPEKKEVKERKK